MYRQRYIVVVSLSFDKCTYRKSPWCQCLCWCAHNVLNLGVTHHFYPCTPWWGTTGKASKQFILDFVRTLVLTTFFNQPFTVIPIIGPGIGDTQSLGRVMCRGGDRWCAGVRDGWYAGSGLGDTQGFDRVTVNCPQGALCFTTVVMVVKEYTPTKQTESNQRSVTS